MSRREELERQVQEKLQEAAWALDNVNRLQTIRDEFNDFINEERNSPDRSPERVNQLHQNYHAAMTRHEKALHDCGAAHAHEVRMKWLHGKLSIDHDKLKVMTEQFCLQAEQTYKIYQTSTGSKLEQARLNFEAWYILAEHATVHLKEKDKVVAQSFQNFEKATKRLSSTRKTLGFAEYDLLDYEYKIQLVSDEHMQNLEDQAHQIHLDFQQAVDILVDFDNQLTDLRAQIIAMNMSE